MVLATLVLRKCIALRWLLHEDLRLLEGNCDGVALAKGTKTEPLPRIGHLREDPPAATRHLPDVAVHLFHAEDFYSMVDSVPAALVGE
jgi:hypothetical protein